MSKPNGEWLTCTCGKRFYRNASYLEKFKSRSCSRKCYTGDPKKRFLALVDKNGPIDPEKPELGPCWIWKGHIDTQPGHGYGKFRFRGSAKMAHWVSYVLFVEEILNGLQALHKCVGRRWCVNPNHIYPGTPKRNTQDQIEQGRFVIRIGEAVNTAVLEKEQIPEIFALYNSGTIKADLARMFGVSQTQIGRILKGESWRHLTKEIDAPASSA